MKRFLHLKLLVKVILDKISILLDKRKVQEKQFLSKYSPSEKFINNKLKKQLIRIAFKKEKISEASQLQYISSALKTPLTNISLLETNMEEVAKYHSFIEKLLEIAGRRLLDSERAKFLKQNFQHSWNNHKTKANQINREDKTLKEHYVDVLSTLYIDLSNILNPDQLKNNETSLIPNNSNTNQILVNTEASNISQTETTNPNLKKKLESAGIKELLKSRVNFTIDKKETSTSPLKLPTYSTNSISNKART